MGNNPGLWLLSIANVEVKAQLIEPQEWHVCTRCKEEKPGSEFYMKFDSRRGEVKRRAQCKPCILQGQIEYRARKSVVRAPASSTLILAALAIRPMSISGLCRETKMSRTAIRAMVPKLIKRGIVKRSAKVGSVKTNHRIPMYELTNLTIDTKQGE